MTIDPNNLASTAKMTFNDDFNSLSLWDGKSGTWTTGDSWGNEKGFTLSGNGEQQWYINSNYAPTQNIKPWSTSDGILNLTAQPTDTATKAIIGDHPYTSGQINTFNSFSQEYGYFEMRAQLPEGKGLWPAFWLLPENNSWPPEIDIIENLGDNMNKYYTTVHTNETGSHTMATTNIATPDLSAGYHNYGVDWEADKTTFYLDGKQVFQTNTPADMHGPMYMVANLAVGGYWPGNPDSSTPFPADMKIDYIRAYSADPNATAVAAPADVSAPAITPAPTATASTAPVSTANTVTASVAPTPDQATTSADQSVIGSTTDTHVDTPLPTSSVTPSSSVIPSGAPAVPPAPTIAGAAPPVILTDDQKLDFSQLKPAAKSLDLGCDLDLKSMHANWHAQHEHHKPEHGSHAETHIPDFALDHQHHFEHATDHHHVFSF